MNIKAVKALAIVSCLIAVQLGYAAAGRDNVVKTLTICTGYIVGGCVVSNITINAVGDKQDIDTEGLVPNNYGTITKSKRVKLNIPVAGKRLFTFTPTEGSSAYKQIRVLFYTLDLTKPFPADTPANMRVDAEKALKLEAVQKYGKTMFCVYRQGPGETQWTQFYLTVTNDTKANLQAAEAILMTIKTDGIIYAYLPSYMEASKDGSTKKVTPKPLIIDLGRKPS